MTEEVLSDFESEAIYLMANFMHTMMYVDGFVDLDAAQQNKPEVLNDYIRYGSAALKAYRNWRSLNDPSIDLQEFIKNCMAHVDGHSDYLSATVASDQLKDTYDKYSLAASLAILQYQKNPVKITVSDEEQ